ncbi:uncharacterized protein BKA55DRAFT_693795 [Fusarium redolens]|uniref:Uncharacterized protein n=1 Tax=Fusarium redolens TaxID=48865 RepID=A0A9P9GLP2_FUSRE|nr:uncharacterized protein BKA55DRAFT_693795 [Fusarium redolens]KAH7240264.1 hypothetical protein BKA55DRAFT_693795 [Fusarium redolens]
MKSFFTVLLAIPAIMAAPAPAPDQTAKQVVACACANDAGDTNVSGYCQYIAGSIVKLDGHDFCFPAATWSEYMESRFTADFCPGYFKGFPNPVCKTVTVCKTIGDYQDIC